MPPREPIRTCVACRQEAGKQGLIRLHRGPDGAIALDRSAHGGGRGAYLHPDGGCLEVARKRRSLERALKGSASEILWLELAAKVIDAGPL